MTELDSTWSKGAFEIAQYNKRGPMNMRVQGWVNGPFGIDQRSYRTWVITHIVTGYSLGVYKSLRVAKTCASLIAPRHKWESMRTVPTGSPRWKETSEIIHHWQDHEKDGWS